MYLRKNEFIVYNTFDYLIKIERYYITGIFYIFLKNSILMVII